MDPDEVAALIETGIGDATATVEPSRHVYDEEHLRAVVVSPAFEGRPLVEQHQLIYDALGERMTRDNHVLKVVGLHTRRGPGADRPGRQVRDSVCLK